MVRRQELLIANEIGIKFPVQDYDDQIRQTQIISATLNFRISSIILKCLDTFMMFIVNYIDRLLGPIIIAIESRRKYYRYCFF